MMLRVLVFLSLLFILTKGVVGQKAAPVVMKFTAVYRGTSVPVSGTAVRVGKDDSLQIDILKFYLANIRLTDNMGNLWEDTNRVHLIQLGDPNRSSLSLNVPDNRKYRKIRFQIGIDSLIQESGAMGGDLDPTKGMYWTWQSGYIHFKLEGKRISGGKSKPFQFHIGGYKQPYSTLQLLELPVSSGNTVNVVIDLEKLLPVSGETSVSPIMSPGKKAYDFSTSFIRAFSIN